MKRTRKVLCVVLLLTLIFTTLVACNTKPAPAEPTPAPTAASSSGDSSSETAQTADNDGTFKLPIVSEPFTITIWKAAGDVVYKTMSNLSEGAYWKEMEARTGIHVDFIHPSVGQETQSLNLLLASDDLPDLIEPMYGYEYPGGYETGVAEGVFYDITNIVKEHCPNYMAALQLTESITKQCYTDSGMISGFWNISVGGPQPPWLGVVVRKDWLDDLGLDTPVTYDDWYNMLKAFKAEKGAVAPMMLYFTGFNPQNVFCGGYNITETFFKVGDTVKYGPLESGYKEYLSMLAKWYDEGLIDPDFATKKDFLPSQEFTTTGKTGAFYEQYLDLTMLKERSDDANYQLIGVPTPRVNANDEIHIRQVNFEAYASRWIMTTDCKDPVTVAKWCDYAYTEEGDLLASYGFEDKTYEIVNGKPQFTEFMYKNPDGLSLAEAYHYYAKLGGAGLYHWDREFAGMAQNDLNAMDVWGADNDGSYILPPVSMTADEASEYATIMNDIETYRSEMVINFILGLEPLDNYDTFVDTIRSMNIDRAIEIYQAALNRYNARG